MGRGFEPLRGHQKPPLKGGFFLFPPTSLPQTKGTVLSVCTCKKANQKNRPFGLHNRDNMLKISRLTRTRIIASLPCEIVLGDLTLPSSKKSFYHQGFFAVKRRAVFILGAMWWALVRGWRRDCVVGGMETRFQWRKAHSRTAKCEAFHVAPRLFFRFLFLVPLTIRQLRCPTLRPINFPELFLWIKPPYNAIICFECEVGVGICIKIH